jgi:hypothetical protein
MTFVRCYDILCLNFQFAWSALLNRFKIMRLSLSARSEFNARAVMAMFYGIPVALAFGRRPEKEVKLKCTYRD